jgi:ABC-2 type transport system permease protein
MAASKNNTGKKLWLPLTLIALVALNWLASIFHTRIDFTNEKRFTLSAPTKKILKGIDDDIQIDIFLKGEYPSAFKKLANSTGDVLNEFKEIAGKRIKYNFISPDDLMEGTDVKWGDTLAASGLFPINLKSQIKAGEQQQLVYPVAMVRYKESVLPVNLYGGNKAAISPKELNSAEAQMEFKFADAINKLSQPNKPMIAYATGNGEPPLTDDNYNTIDLKFQLLKDYNLKILNLATQPVIDDTFKLLLIVKPTIAFTPEQKLKIDQFVMRGGKLLLFQDKLEAELDSLKSMNNQVVAYDRNIELTDLLFKYGVRINPDLVMDLQCDFLPFVVNGQEQMEFLHWNYFPLFQSQGNSTINKNLGLVAGKFTNSIDTIAAEGITKTVLLSSSANSRIIASPAIISGKENVNAPEDAQFKKANIPVAVLLEGKFTSMFNNRLPQALNDSLTKFGRPFVNQSAINGKVIVVADGDMVLNAISQNQPLPMGMNPYTYGTQYQYQFANREFLQNCLDYLVNPSNLSEAKAKDYTLRLLDVKKINEQRTLWQLVNIAAPIALVCLVAAVYQWRRKKRYSA